MSEAIQRLMGNLLAHYPQQALWYLTAVVTTKNATRKEKAHAILQKTKVRKCFSSTELKLIVRVIKGGIIVGPIESWEDCRPVDCPSGSTSRLCRFRCENLRKRHNGFQSHVPKIVSFGP